MKSLEEIKLVTKENWDSLLRFRDKRLTGFSTGLKGLDAALRGLSGIVGIQGAPGACKSTLGLQIASYNARRGVPVLVVDRENGLSRFKVRLMCQIGQVSQDTVLKCSEEELRDRLGVVAELPFYVETSAELSIDLLRSYLSTMWDTYQRPMLLVIDSLQALPRVEADERLSLQRWLTDLDQLKLDLKGNLVIIVTIEKRKGTYSESSNSAGKGTNAIEYKSEILLDLIALDNSPCIGVTVVKHRDGAAGAKIVLQKQLANADPSSFTFMLEEGHLDGL
jgi:replicative DNA helicase